MAGERRMSTPSQALLLLLSFLLLSRLLAWGQGTSLGEGAQATQTPIPCALALFGQLVPRDASPYRLAINPSPCQLDPRTTSPQGDPTPSSLALLIRRGGGCSFSDKVTVLQASTEVGAVVIISPDEDLFSPGMAGVDDLLPLVVLVGAKAGDLLEQAAATQDSHTLLWLSCPMSVEGQVSHRLDALSAMAQSQWAHPHLRRALPLLTSSPDRDPVAIIPLARAYTSSDYPLQARDMLQSTVEEVAPASLTPDLLNALGRACLETGDFSGAVEAFQRAQSLEPTGLRSRRGLIKTMFVQGDILGAVRMAQELGLEKLAAGPGEEGEPDMYWLVVRELSYLAERYGGGRLSYDCATRPSFCCERETGSFPSQTSSPDLFYTHLMIGVFLDELGALSESLAHLQAALRLCPSSALALRIATATPVIFPSRQAMVLHLQQVEAELAQVGQHDHSLPLERSPYLPFTITPATMFLGYQGMGEQRLLATIAQAIPSLLPGIPTTPLIGNKPGDKEGKVHLGVVSAFLRDHSVGRLMQGVLAQLSREKFAVHLFHVTGPMWGPPRESDVVARRLSQGAEEVVTLPPNLTEASEVIAARPLHVLLFPELGMDMATYALAFRRLAPVQATFWGHPVSQGVPEIDYIITSDLFEPSHQDRYAEQRVLFESLSTFFPRPTSPSSATRFPSPETFSLPPSAHIYLIGQTLMKFHPDFDEALVGILEGDPLACLVTTYNANQRLWRVQLEARWRERLGPLRAARSIIFLPTLPRDQFYELMRLAHVVLDTFPFGGGVTSLEAFSVGSLIVTLPSRQTVVELAGGMYRRMGLEDLFAQDVEDYVRLALRGGTNETWRQEQSERILSRVDRLYEEPSTVAEWEGLLQRWAGFVA